MARQLIPLEQAFWARVDKRGPDECWPWKSKHNSKGYARLCRRRRELSASQIAWRLANGREFPAGLYALHSCDNPGCVNPSHIRPGTQRENVADMVAKGRQNWTGLRSHTRTCPHQFVSGRRCMECKRAYDAAHRVQRLECKRARRALRRASSLTPSIPQGRAR